MKVELTESEAESLRDYLEVFFIQNVKDDPDVAVCCGWTICCLFGASAVEENDTPMGRIEHGSLYQRYEAAEVLF